MIDDDSIAGVLDRYADQSPSVPRGLTERVESRYRRRRLVRGAGAAVAVVAVVAGVSATLPSVLNHGTSRTATRSTAGASNGPAKVATPSNGPWTLPAAGALVPPMSTAFPAVTLPARAPDHGTTKPMVGIDPTHLLVASSPSFEASGGLFEYDTVAKKFTTVTAHVSPKRTAFVNRYAVAGGWAIWEVDNKADGNAFTVYKASLKGGAPITVAHVAMESGATSAWYASGKSIYFSTTSGVKRLPLAGGSPKSVRGLSGFALVDGSPWAVRGEGVRATYAPYQGNFVTQEMRNVVTGKDLVVKNPAQANDLSCSPTFCVGSRNGKHTFVQTLDGTARADLPAGMNGGQVRNTATGGSFYVVSPKWTTGTDETIVWDPATGKVGSASDFPVTTKVDGGASTTGTSYDAMFVLGWATQKGAPVSTYLALGTGL